MQDDKYREVNQVGRQLRSMRKARNLSIRALANLAHLSVNTLSLIENGKTSPSVSTLQQIAKSLDVPIVSFFEYDHPKQKAIYQRAGERQELIFPQGKMEKFSGVTPQVESEPFVTRFEPNANSGKTPITIPGQVFIYCLEGQITYAIEGEEYALKPGDSLTFGAYTPHSWSSAAQTNSSALFVVCQKDFLKNLPEQYFAP